MRGRAAVSMVAACLLSAGIAWPIGRVAAQPYEGPPSSMTTYWDVPAFRDHPYKGPEAAKGVLFWSHGVSGQLEAYGSPPPEFIKDFARAGWDVVKVQRNNLHEHSWSSTGVKHVADLVARIEKAHGQGYRHVIAAGQSYGGAISIEAAKRTDRLFGVIATGPGHGSDACGPRAGFSSSRIADTLQRQLTGAIEGGKAARVVVVMAAKDECQGYNNPTAAIRATLQRNRAPFVFLDDTMPIHGHFVGYTNQFRQWYQRCIADFLDPARTVAAMEHVCASPAPAPRFLFPTNFELPRPGSGAAPAGLAGAWSGALAATAPSDFDGQEVCVVVREARAAELVGGIAFGAGPERRQSMSWTARTWKRDGDAFTYAPSGSSYRIVLQPKAATGLQLAITAANGKMQWTAELQRGC